MRAPPLPTDEDLRQRRLAELRLVYSPAEERFDRITRLARRTLNVPIALVSLVSGERQWFKSAQGLAAAETPRDISFCGHAILGESTFVVPDALADPDFADNPLVTGEPGVRFYAGQPIRYDGLNMGTLCVIDHRPRDLGAEDLDSLRSLAAIVENELELQALSEAQRSLLSDLREARRETLIDPVTRLWNRRGIEEVLERELERARRAREPVALMIVSVKAPDDDRERTLAAGSDEVLREVAQRIRRSVRPADAVGRYDDEEFVVYLGGCDADGCASVARRILELAGEAPIPTDAGPVEIVPSVGAAATDTVTELTASKLVRKADEALQRAWVAGGGRFEVHAFPPP